MSGTEIAEAAKETIQETVKENAPSFITGIVSSVFGLIKSVLPYLIGIPAIIIADEKFNDGKGMKFVKGLLGGKEESTKDATTPASSSLTGQVEPPSPTRTPPVQRDETAIVRR